MADMAAYAADSLAATGATSKGHEGTSGCSVLEQLWAMFRRIFENVLITAYRRRSRLIPGRRLETADYRPCFKLRWEIYFYASASFHLVVCDEAHVNEESTSRIVSSESQTLVLSTREVTCAATS